MVLSLAALFLALGGTAIAAKHYLITSTSQIKPSVLRQLQGKRGPQGPAGANGANGANGSQGPAGPSNLSALTLVEGPKNFIGAGEVEGSEVFCPAGQHVVSGGGYQETGKPGLVDDQPERTNRIAWFVIGENSGTLGGTIQAYAYCSGAGQAVAASRNTAERKHANQAFHQALANLRRAHATEGPQN
jgi:hypothetical protein